MSWCDCSVFYFRSTPCPNVKQGDEWGDPSKCDSGDNCSYCHTRTEQQFHLEVCCNSFVGAFVMLSYLPVGFGSESQHDHNYFNWPLVKRAIQKYNMIYSSLSVVKKLKDIKCLMWRRSHCYLLSDDSVQLHWKVMLLSGNGQKWLWFKTRQFMLPAIIMMFQILFQSMYYLHRSARCMHTLLLFYNIESYCTNAYTDLCFKVNLQSTVIPVNGDLGIR